MTQKILILPGDYIGPEIMTEAVKVLETVADRFELKLEFDYGLLGGAAIDDCGEPLPAQTLVKARAADAILLGAVGGPKWDGVERHLRPERQSGPSCSYLVICALQFCTRNWLKPRA